MSPITKFIVCFSTFCVVSSSFNHVVAQAVADEPIVSSSEGKLKGITLKSRSGRNYYGFLGVHYAAKPERFEIAGPPVSWEGIRDATQFTNVCPQHVPGTSEFLGDENCLVLNIYVPGGKLNGKLPVMVFFPGGAWMWGDSFGYGAKYFMDHDIVLVTVNYRLGILGFLSTENEVIQGNFGLKDQVQSLKWIQKNIGNFGGNAEQVTIFGESAGAASVNYHLISPMSRDLFTRAISQSGSALNPWALQREPIENVKKLAGVLDCPFQEGKKGSQDFKECLKEKTTKEIVDAQKHFQKLISGEPPCPFAPTIEKVSAEVESVFPVFLSETPYQLMTDDKLKHKLNLNIPWIIGLIADEGLALMGAALNEQNPIGMRVRDGFNENRDAVYPIALCYEESVKRKNWATVGNAIHQFYFGEQKIGKETAQEFIAMYSDRMFNHGVWKTAKLAAKRGITVYPYFFSFKGDFSFSDFFGGGAEYRGTHMDDLGYLFNMTLFSFKPAEIVPDGNKNMLRMSENLLELWTNFAKTGAPITSGGNKAKWEAMPKEDADSDKEPQWYIIDEDSKMGVTPFSSRMKFWDELPQLREMQRERKKKTVQREEL